MQGCDSGWRNNAVGKTFSCQPTGHCETSDDRCFPSRRAKHASGNRAPQCVGPDDHVILAARQFHSAKCRSSEGSCTIPGMFAICFAVPLPLPSPFQPKVFKSDALPPILMNALISWSRCTELTI